jgi:DNA-binding protein Fis
MNTFRSRKLTAEALFRVNIVYIVLHNYYSNIKFSKVNSIDELILSQLLEECPLYFIY